MLPPSMRLRINELLRDRQLTPHYLAKKSKGRISPATAFRLSQVDGEVSAVSLKVLDALCDVFECDPGELFER